MKRLALCFIVCLFSVLALAQERVEKRVELKNGTVLTGYVQVQPDGSYQVETSAGDKLVFSPSEIARVVNAIPSNNQQEGEIVYKKGGSLYFYATGKPLVQNDFYTEQGWKKYRGAQTSRKVGTGFILSGICLTAAAPAFYYATDGLYDKNQWEDTSYYDEEKGELIEDGHYGGYNYDWELATILVGSGGVALTIAGIVFSVSGNARIKKIARAYNQQPGYVLDFGTQQHGVGLALHF